MQPRTGDLKRTLGYSGAFGTVRVLFRSETMQVIPVTTVLGGNSNRPVFH